MTTDQITILNIVVTGLSALIILILTIWNSVKIENLKSKLDVQNNKSKVLFEESKNAIYSFFSTYMEWLDENDDISKYSYRHLKRMENIDSILEDSFKKVNRALSKMNLFVNDTMLMESTNELIKLTKELQETNILACKDTYYHLHEQYIYE